MRPEAELRELEVFMALAGELHFGRTAERLGLTHARLSQVVASLEARMGTKLFDRTSRHVQLTPRGEQLLRQVTPTYGAIERAYAELRELVSLVKGTLSLGIYAGGGGGPYLRHAQGKRAGPPNFERGRTNCRNAGATGGPRMQGHPRRHCTSHQVIYAHLVC